MISMCACRLSGEMPTTLQRAVGSSPVPPQQSSLVEHVLPSAVHAALTQ